MITAIASPSHLLSVADSAYPATGTPAYAILLSGDLIDGTVVPKPANDWFERFAGVPPQGAKIRFQSTGSLPAPLQANTDYYAIEISSVEFAVAGTLAGALAGPNGGGLIPINSAGSGTVSVIEQPLDADTPASVLIKKELAAGGGYVRIPVDDLGVATIVAGEARKPQKTVQLNNTGATDLAYRHVMIAFGASTGIGQVGGIAHFVLGTEAADQTILAGQTRIFQTTLKVVRLP
jgi:hypothetical protein